MEENTMKTYQKLGDFEFPFGTVTLEDGTTVVSEQKFHRLRISTCDGEPLGLIGKRGTMACCFEQPHGVCMVSRKEIAVCDTGNARVQIIKVRERKQVRSVSGGQLYAPWDVTCTPEKLLFVTDMKKNCVKVFTINGEVLHTYSIDKNGNQLFEKPCRIEYHSHTRKVHVADRQIQRVHVLSYSENLKDFHYEGCKELNIHDQYI